MPGVNETFHLGIDSDRKANHTLSIENSGFGAEIAALIMLSINDKLIIKIFANNTNVYKYNYHGTAFKK